MKKQLCINIPIDTDYDLPEQLKAMVMDIIDTANDHCAAIESVSIDGIEHYHWSKQFSDYLSVSTHSQNFKS